MRAYLLLLLSLPAFSAKPQQLWKEWYLFTTPEGVVGYFSEEVERRSGSKELAISQRWMEVDEGGVETFIGSVAEDSPSLKPLAFFSEKKSTLRAHNIDGKSRAGKIEITFKPIKPSGVNIKKTVSLTSGTFLSCFLPLYLAGKKDAIGTHKFAAIVEDALDRNFDPRSGNAEIMKETKKFRDESCRKAKVSFNGISGEWWYSKAGKLCEIFIPANETRITLSTETEAKAAFAEKK